MNTDAAPETQIIHAAALLRRIRERLGTAAGLRVLTSANRAFRHPVAVRTRTILGADVGCEFGKPGLPSAVTTLVAETTDVVDGRITLVAPAAIPVGSALPLAILVIAGAESIKTVDCYGLRNAALRIDGLDGVSVRAMPGRLWVRISREALAAGIGPEAFAESLYASCRRVSGVNAIEVVIACDEEIVRFLEPMVAIASAQTGEHVRLKWNAFGDLECSSMDCRSCDEAPVCDQLRQVIKIRGRRRRKAHV